MTLILMSSMATRHSLSELVQAYREQGGGEVELRALGGVDAANKVRAGEDADIVLLAAGVMAKLEADGHVAQGSLRPFAVSGMAIAVPAGATVPDLSNGAALKVAMLAAGSVGYSTGPSGDHLKGLWSQWGIAEEMAQRAVQAPPGVPVARLVAEGKADIGVQQLSELIGQPGIVIAGPMPADVQSLTTFTAGVASVSTRKQEAQAFTDWIAAPGNAAIKRTYGMEQP